MFKIVLRSMNVVLVGDFECGAITGEKAEILYI